MAVAPSCCRIDEGEKKKRKMSVRSCYNMHKCVRVSLEYCSATYSKPYLDEIHSNNFKFTPSLCFARVNLNIDSVFLCRCEWTAGWKSSHCLSDVISVRKFSFGVRVLWTKCTMCSTMKGGYFLYRCCDSAFCIKSKRIASVWAQPVVFLSTVCNDAFAAHYHFSWN